MRMRHLPYLGFMIVDLCQRVLAQNLHEQEWLEPNMEIVSTGVNIKHFLEAQSNLLKEESVRWLPYLVVDLAAYDDNLLRQVRQQPAVDLSGLYRLPTGDVIIMAFQLLDVMNYLHSTHSKAYMDWKPEHIFWNGLNRQVKLIDWNVTIPLASGPGEKQNIRDDLRLFCGAVLYVGLTFMDPDYPLKKIGPRPTTKLKSPVLEIQRRYLTDDPDFYQRDVSLSNGIKKIIRQGLHPEQGFDSVAELKSALSEFAQRELGLTENELILVSKPSSPYNLALSEMRLAQQQLLQAQQHLLEAVRSNGNTPEFKRLFDVIKHALMNFPAS